MYFLMGRSFNLPIDNAMDETEGVDPADEYLKKK
jgi:hypothetical protein